MPLDDAAEWNLQKESITPRRRKGYSVLILGFLFSEGILPSLLAVKLQRYSANVPLPARLKCSTDSPDLSLNTFSGNAGSSGENLREPSTGAHSYVAQIFNSSETSKGLK